MKNTIITIAAVVSFPLFTTNLTAALYSMDFSIVGQGVTHDTVGDPLEPSPVVGSNWTLTYANPSSDTTTNEFITVAGNLMRVQDWGGEGTVTSSLISISEKGNLDITGAGLSIGTDAFNAVGTEGVTWFYSINGAARIQQFLGEAELGGSSVNAGTDVGYSFSNISVEAGDTLAVGFSVNVNGTGDGVEISSLVVNFTPVPEPTSAVFLALTGLLSLTRRRRSW